MGFGLFHTKKEIRLIEDDRASDLSLAAASCKKLSSFLTFLLYGFGEVIAGVVVDACCYPDFVPEAMFM